MGLLLALFLEAGAVLVLLGLAPAVLWARHLAGYLLMGGVLFTALLPGCLIYLLIRALAEKRVAPVMAAPRENPAGDVL